MEAKEAVSVRRLCGWTVWLVIILIAFPVASWAGWLSKSTKTFKLSSASMLPTMQKGANFQVNLDAYRSCSDKGGSEMKKEKPRRGDVVYFKYPDESNKKYVKRIVGIPGDRLEIQQSQIRINGQLLQRKSIGEYRYADSGEEVVAHRYRETIDQVSYDILLDTNPGFPTIKKFHVPDGKYFVLGDNRDRSMDSRYFGFVDSCALLGKVVGIK